MNNVLKSSVNWLKTDKYVNYVIVDPDGWDRTDLEQSLQELITEKEFIRRLLMSTTIVNNKQDAFIRQTMGGKALSLQCSVKAPADKHKWEKTYLERRNARQLAKGWNPELCGNAACVQISGKYYCNAHGLHAAVRKLQELEQSNKIVPLDSLPDQQEVLFFTIRDILYNGVVYEAKYWHLVEAVELRKLLKYFANMVPKEPIPILYCRIQNNTLVSLEGYYG